MRKVLFILILLLLISGCGRVTPIETSAISVLSSAPEQPCDAVIY